MRRDPLPSDFVVAKPIGQDSYSPDRLDELQASGRLIGTRKRDGHKVLVEVCDEKIRLYSSGMHEIDHRLNYIRDEVRRARFPKGTVLVSELVVERTRERMFNENCAYDDVGAVTTILGSSFANAQDALGRGPLPRLIVFNALFGPRLETESYVDTLDLLSDRLFGGRYLRLIEHLPLKLERMREWSLFHEWEGLVFYDADYRLTWRQGKTEPRPKGCYKWKPIREDDFIVMANGRRFNPDGSLRDVTLLQWDPVIQKHINCTRLGSFDAETRAVLAANDWSLKVMQVRFTNRYPKSGKLREPVFMRFRDDKGVDACVAPQTWPEVEIVR